MALLNYTNVIMCFIIIWHWSNIPSVWCLIWYYLIMFHNHHLFMHGGYNSEWTSMNSHWSKHNTFFCLKQCIHMNQLYELSVSMCSVAWLAPTHYINSVETYLKHREMRWKFALLNDACHIFEAYVFTMNLALFRFQAFSLNVVLLKHMRNFLNLNHLYRSISFWYLHRFVLCVSAPHAFSEEFWRC